MGRDDAQRRRGSVASAQWLGADRVGPGVDLQQAQRAAPAGECDSSGDWVGLIACDTLGIAGHVSAGRSSAIRVRGTMV